MQQRSSSEIRKLNEWATCDAFQKAMPIEDASIHLSSLQNVSHELHNEVCLVRLKRIGQTIQDLILTLDVIALGHDRDNRNILQSGRLLHGATDVLEDKSDTEISSTTQRLY